eukprot:SAG31_NODE_8743_length_1395_cov_8.237617_1_plen_105_part_00
MGGHTSNLGWDSWDEELPLYTMSLDDYKGYARYLNSWGRNNEKADMPSMGYSKDMDDVCNTVWGGGPLQVYSAVCMDEKAFMSASERKHTLQHISSQPLPPLQL